MEDMVCACDKCGATHPLPNLYAVDRETIYEGSKTWRCDMVCRSCLTSGEKASASASESKGSSRLRRRHKPPALP